MPTWEYEKKYWEEWEDEGEGRGVLQYDRTKTIVGVDEVGYGSWAGPVVAGAVIYDREIDLDGINDSKKLTAKKREQMAERIYRVAKYCGIGLATVEEINEKGLAWSRKEAMRRAWSDFGENIDLVLVDGFGLQWEGVKSVGLIKGDFLSYSIASASIIAKVFRDNLMTDLGKQDDKYMFDKHKGYGTKLHQDLILKYGLGEYHRKNYHYKFLDKKNSLFS